MQILLPNYSFNYYFFYIYNPSIFIYNGFKRYRLSKKAWNEKKKKKLILKKKKIYVTLNKLFKGNLNLRKYKFKLPLNNLFKVTYIFFFLVFKKYRLYLNKKKNMRFLTSLKNIFLNKFLMFNDLFYHVFFNYKYSIMNRYKKNIIYIKALKFFYINKRNMWNIFNLYCKVKFFNFFQKKVKIFQTFFWKKLKNLTLQYKLNIFHKKLNISNYYYFIFSFYKFKVLLYFCNILFFLWYKHINIRRPFYNLKIKRKNKIIIKYNYTFIFRGRLYINFLKRIKNTLKKKNMTFNLIVFLYRQFNSNIFFDSWAVKPKLLFKRVIKQKRIFGRLFLWRYFLKKSWLSNLYLNKINIFNCLNKIGILGTLPFYEKKKQFIIKILLSNYLTKERIYLIWQKYKRFRLRRKLLRKILCKLIIWPFFGLLSTIWMCKLNKVSFYKNFIYFVGLTNRSVTAQMLTRYFAVKLRTGLSNDGDACSSYSWLTSI